jgi:WD40 repeat protein
VAVTSGGEFAYGIADDGTLAMWQRGQAEPIHTVNGFLPIAFRLEYLDDGSGLRFYTEYEQKAFELIPADGNLIRLDSAPYYQKEMKDKVIYKIAFSSDKSLMAVTYLNSYDKDIRLFDLANGKFLRKIPSNIMADFLDFTPDGKSLVVYGFTNKPIIREIDLDTGKVLKNVPINEKHGGYALEVLLSGDKSTMAVLGQMGVMDIYDTETFDIVQSLELDINQEFISNFTFTHDGSRMAIFTADNSTGKLLLKLWDLQSNEMIPAGEFNSDLLGAGPKAMVFSPDDSQLAVATEHGQILLFDMTP